MNTSIKKELLQYVNELGFVLSAHDGHGTLETEECYRDSGAVMGKFLALIRDKCPEETEEWAYEQLDKAVESQMDKALERYSSYKWAEPERLQ